VSDGTSRLAARGQFAAAVAVVWAVGGPARGVAEGLRGAGLLSGAVLLAFVAVLTAVTWALRAREVSIAPALVTLIGLVALFSRWELPEERVHLVLYLPLGWLATRAWDRREWALLAVALAGLGDEALQGLLPERRFDWVDVVANCVAGAVVPLLTSPAAWVAAALVWGMTVAFEPLRATIGPGGPPGSAAAGNAITRSPAAGNPHARSSAAGNQRTRSPGPPTFPPGDALPAAATSPSQAAPYAGHNVVLVTIDALRADHVPPVGHAPVATPALDAFAASAVAFPDALAAGSWTSPSMVSLLSGLHPAVHGVNARGLEVGAEPVLPLETLTAAGWFVTGHAGDPTENYASLGIPTELDRADEAASLASALRAYEEPVFAWVHITDVHAPYDATPERLTSLGLSADLPSSPILDRARTHYTVPRALYPGRHEWLKEPIRALYAAEVADADAVLGRTLEALSATGEADRTLVILTADHGEELLENDGIGHASTTLDSVPREVLQRIPFLVRFPDGRGAGTARPGTIRQQDLMPSLLPLLGVYHAPLSADPDTHGVDRDLLAGGPVAEAGADWFVTSPCGWQCPPERRAERVAAVLDEDRWRWCRHDAGAGEACPPPLGDLLGRAEALGAALGSPTPVPVPSVP